MILTLPNSYSYYRLNNLYQSVLDFIFFQIVECFHRLYRLKIPNLKIQNLKCSKI